MSASVKTLHVSASILLVPGFLPSCRTRGMVSAWRRGSLPLNSSIRADQLVVQSHLQHYVEPVAPTPGATSPGSTPALPSIASMAYGNAGPLLPLGPGTLTLNSYVQTRACQRCSTQHIVSASQVLSQRVADDSEALAFRLSLCSPGRI